MQSVTPPAHELVDAGLSAGIGGRLVAPGGTGLDPIREFEQRLVDLDTFSRLEDGRAASKVELR